MKENNSIKISATIITFNEERNIERCISSLKEVTDEIVVVDSYSTDKTEKKCRNNNVKIIKHEFEGNIQQQNYAVSQASYDYILSLDADEELSNELKKSIIEIKNNCLFDGYTFNRLTSYCGKWIRYCGWYPDTKLRIWNRNKGKFEGINPHGKVIMKPGCSIKHINGDLFHHSYYNINQHIEKINYYTDISSIEAFKQGKKTNILKIIIKSLFKFFRDYFLKLGFLDGYYGFIICVNSMHAKFLKYVKLNELDKSLKKRILRTK